MDERVGFEVERVSGGGEWAWKKPFFLLVVLLGGGLWWVSRPRPQLSGHYRGSLAGPVFHDSDMELQLEHVGQKLSGRLVLMNYRNRREPCRGKLSGQLTGLGVSLQGYLDSGDRVVLNAKVSDDLRWEGKAQLSIYTQPRPFSLRKRR